MLTVRPTDEVQSANAEMATLVTRSSTASWNPVARALVESTLSATHRVDQLFAAAPEATPAIPTADAHLTLARPTHAVSVRPARTTATSPSVNAPQDSKETQMSLAGRILVAMILAASTPNVPRAEVRPFAGVSEVSLEVLNQGVAAVLIPALSAKFVAPMLSAETPMAAQSVNACLVTRVIPTALA